MYVAAAGYFMLASTGCAIAHGSAPWAARPTRTPFSRERKRSWKKLYLALPLDLPPRRNDPGVTGRRRRGTRYITVGVNEGEVAALVAGRYLSEEARGDPAAIKAAIEVVISDLAFELEQDRFKRSGPRF